MRAGLETQRLFLRAFTRNDVDNLVELDSDPEVLRFINGGTPTPRSEIEERILPWFLSFNARPEGPGFLAAIEKATGEFVGWVSLRAEEGRDAHDLALGYRLKKKFWRKGYGTEMASALIDKAFTEHAAERVFACTYSDNLASRGVMEKCGMTLVRTYRMTAAELAEARTYVATDAAWPNGDVEYALDRATWSLSREAHR